MSNTIPFAPRDYYRPQRNNIAELIQRGGEVAARLQAQKGQIWGNALQNIGGIAAGAIQDYSARKQKEKRADEISKRDANFADYYTQSGGNPDPAVVMKIYGPKDGPVIARGLMEFNAAKEKPGKEALTALPSIALAFSKLSPGLQRPFYENELKPLAIKTGAFREEDLPGWTPDTASQIMEFAKAFMPAQEAPKLDRVEVLNKDGTKSYQWVEPKAGLEITSAAPPQTPKASVWVMRGGKVIPIQPGTEQAGDRPYEKPSSTGSDNKIWVMRPGKDGKMQTIFVDESQVQLGDQPANTRSGEGRPSLGGEKAALGFFNRAKQADEELKGLTDQIAAKSLGGQAWMAVAPNFMQTQEGQSYQQAQRAFTEARLRKDSGAAIPETEFANDRKTYFAQPGDSPETIAQKERGRAAVLASLAFQSGRALNEFYGEEAEALLEGFKARQAGTKGNQTPQTPSTRVAVPKRNPFR